MMRRQSVLNLVAFSLPLLSTEEAPSLRLRGRRSSPSSEAVCAKAIEHANDRQRDIDSVFHYFGDERRAGSIERYVEILDPHATLFFSRRFLYLMPHDQSIDIIEADCLPHLRGSDRGQRTGNSGADPLGPGFSRERKIIRPRHGDTGMAGHRSRR
jgi:hypothetical protein